MVHINTIHMSILEYWYECVSCAYKLHLPYYICIYLNVYDIVLSLIDYAMFTCYNIIREDSRKNR